MENLPGTIEHLCKYKPEYISCTYGAGGGNVGANREVCQMIKKAGPIPVTHFSRLSVTQRKVSKSSWISILQKAWIICLLFAAIFLWARRLPAEIFDYATDLVKFVKDQYGDKFEIAVAGSPEGHIACRSLEADISVLRTETG